MLLVAARRLSAGRAAASGCEFYIGFVRRVLIIALAAASLNFILGFGGMVALGHAGFIGVGAYTVVALSRCGRDVGLGAVAGGRAGRAALVAALIGTVALRTRGVYFIMTTLAFAQMLYFVAVSLRTYGGDDGYTLPARPALRPGLDLGNESTFYWVVLALVALAAGWLHRATRSRFGHALMGIRDNETRMRALGYPVFRLQLVAFAIAGAIAGLAGALLAGGNGFVSPATMHWTQSATLLVMVVIGGLGPQLGRAGGRRRVAAARGGAQAVHRALAPAARAAADRGGAVGAARGWLRCRAGPPREAVSGMSLFASKDWSSASAACWRPTM